MGPVDTAKLFEAVEYNDVDDLEDLLENPDADVNILNDEGFSLLHKAAQLGQVNCLKKLLQQDKIQVNIKDANRNTPLFLAILNNKVACLKILLNHPKINVNIMNTDKMTPVHVGAMTGHIGCLKLLLEQKDITINAKDKDGRTPVELAKLSTSSNKIEILKLLDPNCTFEDFQKEDINAQDDDGNTLLHKAIISKDVQRVIQLLTKDQISIHIKNKNDKTQLELMMNDDLFLKNEWINTIIDFSLVSYARDGMTRLHRFAKQGEVNELRCSLQNKFVDINQLSKPNYRYSYTPLHYAIQYAYF